MENLSVINTTNEVIELPPGFRFHPTDEELITHYLSPKVLDNTFTTKAIGDVDLNKVEPWDLPWRANIGEKEWYFFCVRDRKYPTGLRTNRATDAGYWKATGKDKEIYRAKILVGMKKTLVFYRGRAPKGEKSNWVMHEFRLEGKYSMHNVHKATKNEWVICRIFKKSSGGKKVHISGLLRSRNCGNSSQSYGIPSLMDLSSDENQMRNIVTPEGSYMTSFSDPMDDQRDNLVNEFSSTAKYSDLSQFPFVLPNDLNLNSTFSTRMNPLAETSYPSTSVLIQDQSILRILLENNGRQNAKAEYAKENIFSAIPNQEFGLNSCENQEFPFISTAPVDLDCLWNY